MASIDELALPQSIVNQCLSIDLEVGKQDHRIYQLAAVRADNGRSCIMGMQPLQSVLNQLDNFAQGLSFLLGHNILAFDLPHLQAVKPELGILQLPVIDTLRLNPLAFPRNPYHRLVKHYKDGRLYRSQRNDPELDARLTLRVFQNQVQALTKLSQDNPELTLVWHWLLAKDGNNPAFGQLFAMIRKAPCPDEQTAKNAIFSYLQQRACSMACGKILSAPADAWALAYAMAWLSVAGGNSVLPPWVRHQFPRTCQLLKQLRDIPCLNEDCNWCRERHDPQKELQRWFGFDDFRAEPADNMGRPLQQLIVSDAMSGKHVLGILPTGTGKSLCYQIPALSRYDKTGALTVVISPLVALMADQVAGLEARGITSCAALNGLLSMPERSNVLDKIRLGDIGILILSPEQLRSSALRRVLGQREIGAWVLDEAHCISKWGHDFRPDYRYVGRFIREWSDTEVAPVLCLTATAKPDVISDILGHFRNKVGIELQVYDGGSRRDNLDFEVLPTTLKTKYEDILQLLEYHLPSEKSGGAIVYCSTRTQTEEITEFLKNRGLAVEYFHARLKPEAKKQVQQAFIQGEIRVIAATNAFGMGIDKPDVRLVIHADIPGSLENYLQEAGRAGRDRHRAQCILLYCQEDLEKQFSMSAQSRLTQQDIATILRSLRRLANKNRQEQIVVTAGEILAEDEEHLFERDRITDDTRVRTALLWLEESHLLLREENQVQIFPSSLKIQSLEQAKQRLKKKVANRTHRRELLAIIQSMFYADIDEGVSTDELMAVSGLSATAVRQALYELEDLGLANNDMSLTAYVHYGVKFSSRKRLQQAIELETELIALMRETAPDLTPGDSSVLRLRQATQMLKNQGHEALPENIWRLLKGIAMDGRNDDEGIGSIRIRKLDAESVRVTLQRSWKNLVTTAKIRRTAAAVLLQHLLSRLSQGLRGNDLLVTTTLGELNQAVASDLELQLAKIKYPSKLVDFALLWLHEQNIIRLNKGMTVFRPAMTIKLSADKRNFYKADYQPLALHYKERVFQIHVMSAYAQQALTTMADALKLAIDYFSVTQQEFIKRWLSDRGTELEMQTTPQSWQQIVDALNHPVQQQIVCDETENSNMLVLAGPGSGKTRVLVHRIAYLIRVRREKAAGILALAYNRHAALAIKRRLFELIGDDARGITILTCHALAMRMVGASFMDQKIAESDSFEQILKEAISLLKGKDLPLNEADARRDRLLAGFRWIFVDEYQDVGKLQYELISAIAGRTLKDKERQLNLFAVGDDDQNIYAFNGASVTYIRQFAADYQARIYYLLENFRSSKNIILAANYVIARAANRMKQQQPVSVNKARRDEPGGGLWEKWDPLSQGRVQLLSCNADRLQQAVVAVNQLQRLARLDASWDWSKTAIIARQWQYLEPVRSYCEKEDIAVQMADEQNPPIWRLRETRLLLQWLQQYPDQIDIADILQWLANQPQSIWMEKLQTLTQSYQLEITGRKCWVKSFIEWLADWGREYTHAQKGLLLLTAHRSKGLEFDHLVILDGGWKQLGRDEDKDAARRLYYVAMTRARKTLSLLQMSHKHPFLEDHVQDKQIFHRLNAEQINFHLPSIDKCYRRLSLREVDLGFAGRYFPNHPCHRAIAALGTGDTIYLRHQNNKLELTDRRGQVVGRLSQSYRPPAGMVIERVSVYAIIGRCRSDTPAQYESQIRTANWEVVLPELVYTT